MSKAANAAVEAYSQVRLSAQATAEVSAIKTLDAISVGENLRQGDMLIVKIGEVPEVDEDMFEAHPVKRLQLADGETQGSRHILIDHPGLTTYQVKDPRGLVQKLNGFNLNVLEPIYFGPAFTCSAPVTLTHPEHGHRTLPPGAYVSVHQRVFRNEIQRVID